MSDATGSRPLAGMVVIDQSDERGQMCARVLGDLGAEVVLVEPPQGSRARSLPPFTSDGGQSVSFAYRNANKRGIVLDPDQPGDAARLEELLGAADVWVRSDGAGAPAGPDPGDVLDRFPGLVVTSVSDFGLTGPYRDFVATDLVVLALSGMMHRCGLPEEPPLAAPGTFAYNIAAVTAAFGTLTAWWQRLRTGRGQHLDVSVMEAVAQISDWALPGYSLGGEVRRREGSGLIYPVLPCSDGFVRIVFPLSPRQWDALVEWLDHPEELADPQWREIAYRIVNMGEVLPLVADLFANRDKVELSLEGQRRGLAVAPVLEPGEVVSNEHAVARGTFVDEEVLSGVEGRVASGFFVIDGERVGFRHRAPELDEHGDRVEDVLGEGGTSTAATSPGVADPPRPFEGLRLLDFGIGGVGVEVARLFAEQGADVIKIENTSYPDFMRTVQGTTMNSSFASSSRCKRGFGVDLRQEEGLALVHELVRHADVLVENSATGTMERMGLGPETLAELNPRLITINSQLMGSFGPWAEWIGYGPNTRPVGGLTHLWNYVTHRGQPSGVSTIHPDHFVGRLGALVSTASLIGREQTGRGAQVEVAQFESVVGHLGDLLLKESLEPGSVEAVGNQSERGAPWGAYPCQGDDEWCAITVRDDGDWEALRRVMGDPQWARKEIFATSSGRIEHRAVIDEHLASWTHELESRTVMDRLQDAGVPAGMVQGAHHQLEDPHLAARGYLQRLEQPPLGEIVVEGPAFHGTRLPEPVVTPAPEVGQHTREICTGLLGLSGAEVDELLARGVLEEPAEQG